MWECDPGPRRPGEAPFRAAREIISASDPPPSVSTYASTLDFGLNAGTIHIPIPLRCLPLEQLPISARLSGVLERASVRVLGDLHGRSLDEFARQRNCGIKTLRELGAALRLAQHSSAAVLSQVAASAATSCTFLVAPMARALKFAALPSSTRLEGLVRKVGIQELGDLHGRNATELLRNSNIGIGTIVEIQRLIERASRGEFEGIPIEPSAAPVALLSLIEAGLSSLPSRDRELLLDRIGLRGTGPVSLDQLGSDYRLTRERVRQIGEEAVGKLKKTWGPRIPHLLEILKARCIATLSPLSAELLEQWTHGFGARLQLGSWAHIRLIAALDPQFPCWPARRAAAREGRAWPCGLLESLLPDEVPIPVCDVYRAVAVQQNFPCLAFDTFLKMMASTPEIVLHFNQPEAPVLCLRRPNDSGRYPGRFSAVRSLPGLDRSDRTYKVVRPAA